MSMIWKASVGLIALAATTVNAGPAPEDDVVCFGTYAVSSDEIVPAPRLTSMVCMAAQESTTVPLVRADPALLDTLAASGDVVQVTAFLDKDGKAMRLDPLPSHVNAVLVPMEAGSGSTPALVVLRGPSARVPVGPEGLHLFLGGADSRLLVRWDTPGPCAVDIDGQRLETPTFARMEPGDRQTYSFPGTEPGCPARSFTFENLGAWAFS